MSISFTLKCPVACKSLTKSVGFIPVSYLKAQTLHQPKMLNEFCYTGSRALLVQLITFRCLDFKETGDNIGMHN